MASAPKVLRDWCRVGTEKLEGDILFTRLSRKPPAWKAERIEEDGSIVACAVQKAPKGQRGWDVIVPSSSDKGEAGIRTVRVPTWAATIKVIETVKRVEHEKGIDND